MQPSLFLNENNICSCCGARIKVWRKPLIGIAVVELIKLYKESVRNNNQSVHINVFSKQRSNFYTLKYWGMIEGSEKVEGKRTAGMWKPTTKGIQFLLGNLSIPSHVETLNNKVVRFSGDNVFVRDVLGKKFNYDELFA